jgi:predicted dehydrogenase
MVRIGIVGFGFMGRMHLNNYSKIEGAEVRAICDIDPERLSRTAGVAGNIAGADRTIDLTGIELFSDADQMLRQANAEASM